MWVEEAVVSRLQHGASTVPTHILLVIERLTPCVGGRGGGQSTTTRCVHSPHTHILLVIDCCWLGCPAPFLAKLQTLVSGHSCFDTNATVLHILQFMLILKYELQTPDIIYQQHTFSRPPVF